MIAFANPASLLETCESDDLAKSIERLIDLEAYGANDAQFTAGDWVVLLSCRNIVTLKDGHAVTGMQVDLYNYLDLLLMDDTSAFPDWIEAYPGGEVSLTYDSIAFCKRLAKKYGLTRKGNRIYREDEALAYSDVRALIIRHMSILGFDSAQLVRAAKIVQDMLPSQVTAEKPAKHEIEITTLDDVPDEDLKWLIYPYIPIGRLTMIQADSGVGKTMFACGLAALVTTGGQMCGIQCEAGPVALFSAEDDRAALKARVIKSGGMPSLVFMPDDETMSTAHFDGPEIEELIAKTRPRLIIFDPIQLFFGSGVDMNKANQTRPIMQRLALLAQKYECAIVLIAHTGKAQQRAIYKSIGSVDIIAATRSALYIVRDPQKMNNERIAIHIKSSNAAEGKSIRYRITDAGGVEWMGLEQYTERDHLKAELQMEKAKNAEADYSVEPLVTVVRKLVTDNPGRMLELDYDTLTVICEKVLHFTPYVSGKAYKAKFSAITNELRTNDGIQVLMPTNAIYPKPYILDGVMHDPQTGRGRGVKILPLQNESTFQMTMDKD